MGKVEYDTHKTPTITLSEADVDELEQTDWCEVETGLFLIKVDYDRLVVAKQIPYNCIKFGRKKGHKDNGKQSI